MQPEEYEQVPRHEDQIMEHNDQMVPIDSQGAHDAKNRFNNLTLKLKFIVPLAFIIASFVLCLILLILSVGRPVKDFYNPFGLLQTISYISISNPVVEIQPAPGGQICDDVRFEAAGLGQWLGTKQGCYCSDTGEYQAQTCNPTQLQHCTNIGGTWRVETFTWNGDRFCMRRLYDFFRLSGGCPSGYKKCGSLLCVPTVEMCPITDVRILQRTDPTPVGYTAKPLSFDKKLVYISNPLSDNQFAQFSYSTGVPCLNSRAFSPRLTYAQHALEVEPHTGCGEYTADSESQQVDSLMTETDYYKYNYVYDKVQSVPLFLTTLVNSNVTLSARYRFLTVAQDNCAQFYITNVPKLNDDVEEFAFLYRGISIAGMILTSITLFIAIVYIRVIKRDGFWIMNREEPFARKFMVHIVLLTTLYAVTTTILGNLASNKIDGQETYLKDLASSNCFATQPKLNDGMNDIKSYLVNKIDGLVFINNILAAVSLGVTVFMIFIYVFRRQKGYEKGILH